MYIHFENFYNFLNPKHSTNFLRHILVLQAINIIIRYLGGIKVQQYNRWCVFWEWCVTQHTEEVTL